MNDDQIEKLLGDLDERREIAPAQRAEFRALLAAVERQVGRKAARRALLEILAEQMERAGFTEEDLTELRARVAATRAFLRLKELQAGSER
jgi:uncharacterized protein YjiS (DUF1127 family)